MATDSCTRSSQVGAFFRVFTPLARSWQTRMPSWRMTFFTSLVLTMRPCSISKAARIRKMP